MKKKILMSLICGAMVLGIATGCKEKTEDKKDNSNTNVSENQNNQVENEQSSITNSTIEETLKGYITALHENNDSQTAYQYIDYVGLTVWQELGINDSGKITEQQAINFLEKYNSYINDTSKVDKITSTVNYVFTSEYYKKQDEELENGIAKYKTYEIKRTDKITDHIYSIKVQYYFTANSTNTGYDRFYTLLEKDGKYFIVNSYAIYNANDLSLGKLFE